MPGSPGVIWGIKEVCKNCRFWTRNPEHDTYRCRTGACPDVIRREKLMQSGDEGRNAWEKEHEPARWLEYTWKSCQRKMREIAEVLELHPELDGTLDIPREESNEDSKSDE